MSLKIGSYRIFFFVTTKRLFKIFFKLLRQSNSLNDRLGHALEWFDCFLQDEDEDQGTLKFGKQKEQASYGGMDEEEKAIWKVGYYV